MLMCGYGAIPLLAAEGVGVGVEKGVTWPLSLRVKWSSISWRVKFL